MNSRTQDLADSATALARRSVDKLTDAASSVEGSMRGGADSLRYGAERSVSQAREIVKANPLLSSIALAVVIGAVVGWLIKR